MYDRRVRTGGLIWCALLLFGTVWAQSVPPGGFAFGGAPPRTAVVAPPLEGMSRPGFRGSSVGFCRFCRHRPYHHHPFFGAGIISPFFYPGAFYPGAYGYPPGYFDYQPENYYYPEPGETLPQKVIVVHDIPAGSRERTDLSLQNSPGAQVTELAPVFAEEFSNSIKRAARRNPATVFVLRDGSLIETRRYTMTAKSLYLSDVSPAARAIPVDELDLAATAEVNRERGMELQIPSGPNEVLLSF